MAITKARKEEILADYLELLDRSQAIFIAEYGRMNVKRMEALRAEVRKANGAFYVTKNTLLLHALEQKGRPMPAELLSGQVAAGFALGDPPELAKMLLDYARKEELFTIKGGILDSRVLNADQVEALSKLPSLPELRAQLLGVLSAPARNVVSAVANGVRQLINVMDAYARKEETAGGEAAA